MYIIFKAKGDLPLPPKSAPVPWVFFCGPRRWNSGISSGGQWVIHHPIFFTEGNMSLHSSSNKGDLRGGGAGGVVAPPPMSNWCPLNQKIVKVQKNSLDISTLYFMNCQWVINGKKYFRITQVSNFLNKIFNIFLAEHAPRPPENTLCLHCL